MSDVYMCRNGLKEDQERKWMWQIYFDYEFQVKRQRTTDSSDIVDVMIIKKVEEMYLKIFCILRGVCIETDALAADQISKD